MPRRHIHRLNESEKAARRKHAAEWMAGRREKLRAAGLCDACGKTHARPGEKKCDACRDRETELHSLRYHASDDGRLRSRQKNREKRAKFAEQGTLKQETKKAWIWYKYKLTPEQFEAMLTAQGNRCAICGQLPTKGRHKNLVVDHCHDSGKIRSLLCDGCNRGIGFLEENSTVLRAAADYIDRWAVEHFGLSAQEAPSPKRRK